VIFSKEKFAEQADDEADDSSFPVAINGCQDELPVRFEYEEEKLER
jgi:hypothetical protein